MSDEWSVDDLIDMWGKQDEPPTPPHREDRPGTPRVTRAALLDALADVVSATRTLLGVAEDALRSERERLLGAERTAAADSAQGDAHPGSDGIDITY